MYDYKLLSSLILATDHQLVVSFLVDEVDLFDLPFVYDALSEKRIVLEEAVGVSLISTIEYKEDLR